MLSFLPSRSLKKSFLILTLSHFVLDFFSGIWPMYKTLAGIDMAQAGLLTCLSGFCGESLQIFFGYFSDKGFRKQILIFGLLVSSSILWVSFSQGALFYFCLLLCLNIGSGAFHPAGVGYAGGLTKKHKGKTILLFTSGGLFGLACSQLIFTKVLTFCGGHALILFIPVIGIVLWLIKHPLPSLSSEQNISSQNPFSELLKVKKPLLLLYLTQLSNYALILSILFLLPDILKAKTSSSWIAMGGGHFCYVIGAAFALLPGGHLCDRYGQKKVILTALSLSSVLLYTLAQTSELSLSSSIFLLFLLGASLSSVTPMIVSWGHKIAPSSPSSVSALLMGLAWCFSYLGPFVAGKLYIFFDHSPEVYTLSYLGLLLPLSISCASQVKTPTVQEVIYES